MTKSPKRKSDEPKAEPPWKRVVEAIGIVAALITSVGVIITAGIEAAGFVSPWIPWLKPPELVLAVAADQVSRQVYERLFADAGLPSQSVSPDQIATLDAKPAVIVIDNDAATTATVKTLQQHFSAARLIAMGPKGAELIDALEPNSVIGSGQTEVNFNDPVVLGTTNLSTALTAGLPAGQPFNVYAKPPANVLDNQAVFDQGSLAAVGAVGIVERATRAANQPCGSGYWPVARHGRYVLWGYVSAPQDLTAEGKRLLVNLVTTLRTGGDASGPTPPDPARTYTQPGQYQGDLACPVTEQDYTFLINQPGTISLKVQSQDNLALMLGAPGMTSVVARKDDTSPMLTFPVTPADIARGTQWFAQVIDFELNQADDRKVSYTIAIDYPAYVSASPRLWLAIGTLALVALGASLVWAFKRLRFPQGSARA